MDDYERIVLIKQEVFVYRIPQPSSSRGHRAANWNLDNPDWSGRAKLVAIGSKLLLKLEDKSTGNLFAKCPIDCYPSPAVEAVIDSSRYFVIRLQDDSGRSAWIGIGFADRGDSFDLSLALRDFFRREEVDEKAKREEEEETQRPKLDLGFKEGQTITISIGKHGSGANSRPKSTAGQQQTVVPLLPPPPSHGNKVRPTQPEVTSLPPPGSAS